MTIPEPLDDPWTEAGPSDRLPVSRQRRGEGRGREEQHERGRDNTAWDGGSPGFERVPPQDLDAEQSVLGGMLLSKDAIADVVEIIKGHDFYRPAHETVFQAILDLYAKGEPADPITVAAELTKRGEITRVGGASYLHTLVQSVPTAANASYYAEIVHERAVLRRLVEAGTKITQMGYAADGDVDEIVNSAQAEIYAVTEQRTSEDYLPLGDIMEGALDEIEAIGSRSGEMTGVPTGFTDFDSLTNGLHPGQMIVIAARPAMGKALALDTPLPTPTGWTTMREAQPGDFLLDATGRPTRVVAATGVLHDRPCYKITFDDGSSVVADAEHQWLTDTRASRRSAQEAATEPNRQRNQRMFASVKTTKEIAETVRCVASDRRLNHSVRTTAPLDLPKLDLPVPPYTLGAWLAGVDPELLGGNLLVALRDMGVLGDKHIPQEYLRASLSQRRELLAGLLDTDGTVTGTGAVQFAVTNRALAEGFRELVLSLGYRCGVSTKRVKGRSEESSTCYKISFTTADEVFRLSRKQQTQRDRSRPATPKLKQRFITDVQEVDSVPVRCVQVDNPAHLYLATRSMIPTHNSTLALDFARAASIKNNLPSVIFSLEMGRNEIAMRLLSAEARVALHHMRSGTMTDEDWTRLARRMPDVSQAPLYIDDSPNLSMMEIRAKCRRLKQRNGLKLVVIDYLQLMQSGGSKRAESRQQEVSDMSRNLKLLAKELELPVIALSQLNRGPEQRTDKKPMVSDLRESGCVTAGTRVLRADTGAEVTMGELLASGERDIPVWSLDESLRLVPRTMTHVFPSGVKEVFRLRLASGKEIEATANHPFLTYDGWRPLGELSAGSRIATPRRIDAPARTTAWAEPELVMLAHLLGDGCVAPRQSVHYTSNDEANLRTVEEAAAHFGLYGKRAHERFLPPGLFGLPDEQVRLFLRHLWATDGSVTVSKSGAVRIYYATTSERLARDLQLLLLRLDIRGRLRAVGSTRGRPGWAVDISGADDQRRFLRDVGVHGARAKHVITASERLRDVKPNTNLDTVPEEVWDTVRELMRGQAVTTRAFQSAMGTNYCGSALYKASPGRARLSMVAEVLQSADLDMLATSDVFWDEVVSVESRGRQEVYDATVLGTHNFIADGINIHNSIEQDADMVVLLHREDAYEKESPRAGEADLIVAKHRNGPTATITVAFQGHYSRFVDMAQT
ncbi:replicative DNA helicase [Streptomyces sp. NPDC050433]|uniref:replicative DNA helicase n=1 Tax=unclassified Streptomyces TaxID=2593676 RepID=UPI00342D742C